MKSITKFLKKTTAALSVALLLAVGNFGSIAQARTEYTPGGTLTSATPVFNEFYNVPNGVGDEADFVRLRPQTSTANADYVDTLKATCNNGDAFTVRTYVHNGADPSKNDNGSGTAVARDVVVAMQAPLNTENTGFTFTSKISASNAASVTDTGKLACGKNVKLTLVPKSVKVYSKPLGWNGVTDSAVNGSLKIGSRVLGSGDVWGCWDDRVIVTYDVKVEEVKEEPKTPVYECTNLVLAFLGDRKDRRVRAITRTRVENGAKVEKIETNFGDGTVVLANSQGVAEHTYKSSQDRTVVSVVTFKLPDNSLKTDTCKEKLVFDKLPPVTPPKELPRTGSGSLVGMFAAISVAAGLAHKFVWARRFDQ